VRGKRAVGRLGRDQPQVRASAGEQGGTAEEDGRDVQADLVDEPGVEELAIDVGAALDHHVLCPGGRLGLGQGGFDSLGEEDVGRAALLDDRFCGSVV